MPPQLLPLSFVSFPSSAVYILRYTEIARRMPLGIIARNGSQEVGGDPCLRRATTNSEQASWKLRKIISGVVGHEREETSAEGQQKHRAGS